MSLLIELIKGEKSLLVLDIDDTILKHPEITYKWWKNTFDYYYNNHNDYDLAEQQSLKLWEDHISENLPVHTNEYELNQLLLKCKELNIRVICLTARNNHLEKVTLQHLKHLNIQIDEIYYNNNKGDFLKSFCLENNIIGKDAHIFFIDDLKSNIDDVNEKLSELDINIYSHHINC